MSFDVQIQENIPDYVALLEEFVEDAAILIRKRMKEKLHEGKAGEIYGGHRASAPGEAPAADDGDLEDSLKIAPGTLQAELYSNELHAFLLEEGTKDAEGNTLIEPRPMWDATVDEMIPVLELELIERIQLYA